MFNAVMRNGISPTSLSGGVASNVIPTDVSAVLNIRTIPGNSIDEIVDRLVQWIDDENVEVTVTGRGHEAPASNPDSPMFEALSAAAHYLDEEITYSGVPEHRRNRQRASAPGGDDSYGILHPDGAADEERMHGHDDESPSSRCTLARGSSTNRSSVWPPAQRD